MNAQLETIALWATALEADARRAAEANDTSDATLAKLQSRAQNIINITEALRRYSLHERMMSNASEPVVMMRDDPASRTGGNCACGEVHPPPECWAASLHGEAAGRRRR